MAEDLHAGPILAIAIPAYNDFEGAISTLRSLAEFRQDGRVELLISDNASEDNLHDHIRRYAKAEIPQLKIYLQEKNLGFAGNLKFLAEQSNALWVWFVGVGEIITPGGVEAVIRALKNYKPDHLMVNASSSTGPASRFDFVEGQAFFHEAISLNVFRRTTVVTTRFEAGVNSDEWWPHLKLFLNSFVWGGASAIVMTGTGAIRIAENYSGWWYHKPMFMDVYLEKLRLVTEGLSLLESRTSPARPFLLEEEKRLRGIQFGYMFAENRKQGHKPFCVRHFRRARELGVGVYPLIFAIAVSIAPLGLLRFASLIRRKAQTLFSITSA